MVTTSLVLNTRGQKKLQIEFAELISRSVSQLKNPADLQFIQSELTRIIQEILTQSQTPCQPVTKKQIIDNITQQVARKFKKYSQFRSLLLFATLKNLKKTCQTSQSNCQSGLSEISENWDWNTFFSAFLDQGIRLIETAFRTETEVTTYYHIQSTQEPRIYLKIQGRFIIELIKYLKELLLVVDEKQSVAQLVSTISSWLQMQTDTCLCPQQLNPELTEEVLNDFLHQCQCSSEDQAVLAQYLQTWWTNADNLPLELSCQKIKSYLNDQSWINKVLGESIYLIDYPLDTSTTLQKKIQKKIITKAKKYLRKIKQIDNNKNICTADIYSVCPLVRETSGCFLEFRLMLPILQNTQIPANIERLVYQVIRQAFEASVNTGYTLSAV